MSGQVLKLCLYTFFFLQGRNLRKYQAHSPERREGLYESGKPVSRAEFAKLLENCCEKKKSLTVTKKKVEKEIRILADFW